MEVNSRGSLPSLPNKNGKFRVLACGDVVGRPGREALRDGLPAVRKELQLDMVIVNCENSAGGLGLEPKLAEELLGYGIDVITLGDHTWQKKDIKIYLERNSDRVIRPANYPTGAPGRGWTIWHGPQGINVGVFNLLGRVFLNLPLDCPFYAADQIIASQLQDCQVIVCDMHAEATSEKVAMGRYLDGKVSLVFGTHTHVQTADERILAGGTAYITDLGMTGNTDSVIGMQSEIAIARFKTGLPYNYEVAVGAGRMNGVVCDIDSASGRAESITRLQF